MVSKFGILLNYWSVIIPRWDITLYFISFRIVSQSTISMYYLHVHVSVCINMHTHGRIVQCIKKSTVKLYHSQY